MDPATQEPETLRLRSGSSIFGDACAPPGIYADTQDQTAFYERRHQGHLRWLWDGTLDHNWPSCVQRSDMPTI